MECQTWYQLTEDQELRTIFGSQIKKKWTHQAMMKAYELEEKRIDLTMQLEDVKHKLDLISSMYESTAKDPTYDG
jgi:hypothetical protein